ncbi:MAG: hypothetical protein NVS2B8_07950 [Vulcanimicrobiaceae bacterium]
MSILGVLWLIVCISGVALSFASARVLGPASRATAAGWFATAGYFAVAAIDVVRGTKAPLYADDVLLAVLAIAFVTAGRRDEPQAEPWYLPTHAGLTGAQRRAARDATSTIEP